MSLEEELFVRLILLLTSDEISCETNNLSDLLISARFQPGKLD